MFGHVICFIRYIQSYKTRRIKTRPIKIKNIENEEIIMAMAMAKIINTTVITTIIIIIMMIMRIKVDNRIKKEKR